MAQQSRTVQFVGVHVLFFDLISRFRAATAGSCARIASAASGALLQRLKKAANRSASRAMAEQLFTFFNLLGRMFDFQRDLEQLQSSQLQGYVN
eukprot:9499361-Pyramimonas_sp.AAC.1